MDQVPNRKLAIDDEFRGICQEIASHGWTELEWAKHESCDWFQTENYCGGFDADEGEFCFSLISNSEEFWFQVPLAFALRIADGEVIDIDTRLAD